jgi:hypothetical protein
LRVSAGGLRAVSEQTSTAERVTVRTTLTKAGVASLHKHHRGVKVKLTASFKPVHGSSSAIGTTVKFG